MTPEEFYWRDKINKNNLYEMRLKSLDWMLGCFDRGTIRKSTIVNLIPKQQLEVLLKELEEDERYEDCMVVKEVLDKIYTNEPEKTERNY